MKSRILLSALILLFVGLIAQPLLSVNIDDDLVAYWAFNETKGDTASDSSENGHDGMLIGDPQWVDGYYGGGLEFDQVEDEVNIPYHADLNPEVFTICAWANVEPGSTNHRAVVSSRADFPQRGFIFYAEPNQNWEFWTGGGPNHWQPIRGPAVNLGEWDHLAGTYADGKMMFYVNGKLEGERDTVIHVNPQEEFLIGAGANETANHNYFFKGIIDEVRLYNRVLDEDEVAAVMESESLDVEASGKIAVTWGELKDR